MRKNNKGFTLIEIIAVVAILGIISVVVVPNIFSLVTQSRDEIYLQDARRLIAQAQYKMSSNSSNIEKPSNGECIVMSLNYLNINDFQSPPHGGAYMSDASFVVIKSDGGTYKYAAMLVEHTSDGIYRGVKLSTEEDLNSKTAHKSITSFNSGEIRYVDSQTALAAGATEASQVDTAYIGRYLKDYGTNQQWLPTDGEYIIGRYNYEKEVEHGAEDTSMPKITPKVFSSDSKNPESLLVNLTVSATDADSPISSLQVCSFVSRNKDLSFPEMDSAYCEPYGTSGNYSKSYDLSKAENGEFSYKEQAIAYVYVAVYDPEKNSDKKKIEYFIRENEPPTIKSFNVIPADEGKYKLPNVKLSAEVSDDMDNLSDLQFCLQQDKDSNECNSYKPYSAFFNNGVHNYTFVDENGKNLGLDGSKHTLKLFVKDSLDEVSSSLVSYEIYKNQAPIFTKIKMIPNRLDNKNLYSVNFDIDAADDISNPYNLKIRICDDKMNVDTDCKFMSMSDYNNRERDGLFAFEFSNQEYDGKDRTVNVTLEDEHGLSTSQSLTLTNVYKNKAPSIKINSIVGTENVCANCTDGGGSYNTRVSFAITDDLVVERDFTSHGFQICISEKKSDCEKQSNFQTYFGNEASYEFKRPSSDIYGGIDANKKLYIVVIDNFGAKGEAVGDYKIYKNQAPEISGSFEVSTTENHNYCDVGYIIDEDGNYKCNGNIIPYSFNIPRVKFDTSNLNIQDDFNEISGEICYYVGSDSSKEKCYSAGDDDSIQGFLSNISTEFTFLDNNGKKINNYDGQRISARIKVTDNYGVSTYSDYASYTLYSDEAPDIKSVNLKSSILSEDSSLIYNSNLVSFEFSVLDFYDRYSVCITEKSSCTDDEFVGADGKNSTYSGSFSSGDILLSYKLDYDGENHGWDKEYKYSKTDDTLKRFNFFVKDSHGNITKYNGTLNYNVYAACSNETKVVKERAPLLDVWGNEIKDVNGNIIYEDDNDIIPIEDNKIISPDACAGKCYYKYTDANGVEILNPYKAQYARQISYIDRKSGTSCGKTPGDVSDKYCNHNLCFMLNDGYSATYIGLRYDTEIPVDSYNQEKIDEFKELGYWTFVSDKFTVNNEVENQRCSDSLREGRLLFCSDDVRCNDNNYCEGQGELNCSSERTTYENSSITCSKYKFYNPKPCSADGSDTECYLTALRPCSNAEYDAVDDNGNLINRGYSASCLRTCNEDETPEVNLCTPYSIHDFNDAYNIISPCEDESSEDCVHADKRTCDFDEEPNDACIRMCGKKKVPKLDDDGNIIDGEEEEVPEVPEEDNCTNNPPLTYDQNQEIYDACANPLKEKYNNCKTKYINDCRNALHNSSNGFCLKDKLDSTWEEISCNGFDESIEGNMVRYCERNFIDGKCFNSSNKCDKICKTGDSDDVCNQKLIKAGCQKICYEKVDCSSKHEKEYRTFECKGFYKTYSAYGDSYRIELQYTGVPICPEFYNYVDEETGKTGKEVEYPFKETESGSIRYIEFNQKEQIVEENKKEW